MAVPFGLGVAAVPDYQGFDDCKVVPDPFINWRCEQRYFDLTDLTAKGNVLGTDIIEFGPRLRARPKRDDIDNNGVDDPRWRGEFWFSQDVAVPYNGQLAGF